MDKIFKSERELLQGIINKEGDCISVAWCLMCPFQDACVGRAINEAKLLPKEERVKRAYERLFDQLMENELDDQKEDDNGGNNEDS
jgi:hypothetical protein